MRVRSFVRFSRAIASLDELAGFARALAASLRPGDVVLLSGPLGAGKTTLVRSICAALGIDVRLVSSPTFALVNVYDAPPPSSDGTRPPVRRVIHADAYRATDPSELEAAGLDSARTPGSCSLIEWGERVESSLSEPPARLTLTPTGPDARRADLDLPDAWASRWAEDPGVLRRLRGPTPCPVTGEPVDPDSPTFPFANERARLADLHAWLSGSRAIPEGSDFDADAPPG